MIGRKLTELIRQKNVKQIKLAKYLGISPSRLSNYLSDKREPDIGMLAQMARYLDVDLNYFADVRFYAAKNTVNTSQELTNEGIADNAVKDSSVSYVPYLPINSKKRNSQKNMEPISSVFIENVDLENVVMLKVSAGVGGEVFKPDDILLVSKFDKNIAENGILIIETGRNSKLYQLIRNGNATLLLDISNNKVTDISQYDSFSGYYTVLWIFKKVVRQNYLMMDKQ